MHTPDLLHESRDIEYKKVNIINYTHKKKHIGIFPETKCTHPTFYVNREMSSTKTVNTRQRSAGKTAFMSHYLVNARRRIENVFIAYASPQIHRIGCKVKQHIKILKAKIRSNSLKVASASGGGARGAARVGRDVAEPFIQEEYAPGEGVLGAVGYSGAVTDPQNIEGRSAMGAGALEAAGYSGAEAGPQDDEVLMKTFCNMFDVKGCKF
ncbi:hypothetical protein RF11_11792 [Thelohanellus kitauei]|uniref:Uncharacterized protein n=1 Tax=Thelohanellus kitauei TaxID=669202 RepID=A0A0C2MIB8_THEKT|nr:hypothetical protein RF11_11792 [Thelohanellus kitauei]